MKSYDRSVTPFIQTLLPAFIHEMGEDSRFQEFLIAYYEWLELEGNAFNLIQTLDRMNSIDDAIDDYYDLFHDELASELPLNITADRKLTLKRITDLYRSAGTEPAVKLLFRILYGEEIEIEYPSDNILRPSDGIWVEKKYITLAKPLTSLSDPNMTIDDIQNREVFFSESGAYAITESYEESNSTYTVYMSNLVGTPVLGDNIRFFDDSSEIDEPCLTSVDSIVIENKGTGYKPGTFVPLVTDRISILVGDAMRITSVDDNGGVTSVSFDREKLGAEPFNVKYIDVKVGGLQVGSDGPYEDAYITVNLSVVNQEAGYYDSTRGFLSDNIVIQDGFKFQQYSYTIRSSVPIEQYSEILKRTVHPAGVRFDSAD